MLTIDHQLDRALQDYAMPVESFAALASLEGIRGASRARLHESFRSGRSLRNDVALRLLSLWQEVQTLCERAQPLKLDLRDAQLVYRWLTAVRAEKFYIVVIGGNEAEDPKTESA